MNDAGDIPKSGFKNQILKSGVAGLSVRVLSVLSGLLSSIILARLLGPSEYGLYAFVLAVIMIIALPVQMGLPTLIVRETAKAKVNADWATMRGAWRWGTLAVLLSSSVMILCVMIWLALGPDVDPTRRDVLIIGLPLIPLLALAAVRGAALRGLKRVFMGIFPDQVMRPLLLAGFVGLFTLFSDVDAATAMALYVTAATIALIAGVFALARARPAGLRTETERRMDGPTWRKSLIPLTLIVGFNVVTQNTDLIMLGLMRTDAEVGVYRIALSLSALAIFGLTVVNLFIQPYFAEAYTKGDMTRLQKLASGSSAAALSATIPVVGIFWLVGSWIIGLLYGQPYVVALTPLLILLAGQTVSAFFGSVGNVLTMSGNERQNLHVLAVSTGTNVVLNFVLIPSYGTVGAAIATGTSIALLNTLLWIAARRTLDIDSSPFGFLKLRKRK